MCYIDNEWKDEVKYEMFSSTTAADPTENQQQDICSALHNSWEKCQNIQLIDAQSLAS